MATLALSFAGSALGNAVGGPIGKSAGGLLGAMIGGMLDRKLFGSADRQGASELGRVTDFQVSGSSYGGVIPVVWGRWRLAANVIWLRGIREVIRVDGDDAGGKGGLAGGAEGGGGSVTTYHYYCDLALGLCEGELTSIYRIFADRQPLDPENLAEIRFHYGAQDQARDPLIEAVEGSRAPAFRGLAYIVLENLYLNPFGSRIPQFEVEVFRGSPPGVPDARHLIESVCLIPASGEFAYDPQIVRSRSRYVFAESPFPGRSSAVNSHAGRKASDFTVAIDNLEREIPNCTHINFVYAWFGTSIDVAACELLPECEYANHEGDPETTPYAWRVKGKGRPYLDRDEEQVNESWPVVSTFDKDDGSLGLYYGGTVSDQSVIAAIADLRDRGYEVLFYPFILMDIPPPDPEPFPWRGRITGAAAGVATFFERPLGYLNFIDHCMSICEDAGGVDAFAVGTEMVGLNRIRDGSGNYPSVSYWRDIAADAKSRLGSSCKITYTADWSEYRYYDRGGGNVDFPLDALWSDPNIDVVGIDAYFPITDTPSATYDKAVFRAGWSGGELIDYFYASEADRDLERRGYQPVRTPIDDQFYAIKNIRLWWETTHTPRAGGVPTGGPTGWAPRSRPIWFTEYGFPTVNCAGNQPNVFIDPKSVESSAPYYSNSAVDRQVQRVAIEATEEFWADPANNPTSPVYGGPMLERLFCWCWDARPYPFFPTLKTVWADGENYRLGHWINGKIGNMQLSEIVRDLCLRVGLTDDQIDVTALDREVIGYVVAERRPVRELISVLQIAYFFDAAERDGVLTFFPRSSEAVVEIDPEDLGAEEDGANDDSAMIRTDRTLSTELPISVDVVHIDEDRDYQTSTVTVRKQVGGVDGVTTISLPVILTQEDAQAVGQRALREIWQGRDSFEWNLPNRGLKLDAGDRTEIPVDGVFRRVRVEKVSYGAPGLCLLRGVAADGGIPEFYTAPTDGGSIPPGAADPLAPIRAELLDMPLMVDAHASTAESFYFAACPVGDGRFRGAHLYQPSADGLDYTLVASAPAPSTIGDTITALAPGLAGRWDRANSVEVVLDYGTLQSLDEALVLDGANAALIGAEVVQFATATLVSAGRYRLSNLLRGQLGTEQDATTHAIGTRFVLLSPARQPRATFPLSRLGVQTAYRAAPAPQAANGDLSAEVLFTNTGIGLRPYSPVRVAAAAASGDIQLSWIRRTRVGGDAWLGEEVPLSEDSEAYDLLVNGLSIVRTVRVGAPAFSYTAAMQSTDFGGPVADLDVTVHQISRLYGRGIGTRTTLHV